MTYRELIIRSQCMHKPFLCLPLKPPSHRIVRLLDRTIGCDLANARPIGNVCYDPQKRSHTAIGLFAGGRSSYDWSYAWSRDQHRLEKIDDKIHHIKGKRTTSGSHKLSIVRSIVEFCMSNRLVVPPVVRWHDQLHDYSCDRLRFGIAGFKF